MVLFSCLVYMMPVNIIDAQRLKVSAQRTEADG